MDVYNWAEITEEYVTPLVTRRAVHTSRMTVLNLRLKQGAVLPMHQHPHEQITMMVSGLVRVQLDGKDALLRPGDILLIPSNAPHLFEALEDSVETDVFTPPREDLMPKPTAG
jgi:quercetin dioxygenase-like cupin family protein